MYRRYIIILVSAGVMAGCAAKKTIISNPQPKVVAEEPIEQVIDSESDGRDETNERVEKPKQIKAEKSKPKQESVRWVFTDRETENVRITNYDPLADGRESLVLELSKMGGEFCYPYKGKVISGYGYRGRSMHTGVDIKAVPRDTIRAAFDGVVRMSKPYSGYGNVIVVRHYNGLETVYSHNARNLVHPNDVVKAGEGIALAGRTGRATTEHLHFEVRVNGNHINPKLLIDTDNYCLRSDDMVISRRGTSLVVSNSTAKQVAGQLGTTSAPSATMAASEVKKETEVQKQTETASDRVEKQYHTVAKGDILSRIAIKYKTSVAKICSLNNITEKKVLQIGMKLRVK